MNPPPPIPLSTPGAASSADDSAILNPRSRRNVTASACEGCRRRKSKCDGRQPQCSACSQRNLECVYLHEPTEKRSIAIKRKSEDLERKLGDAVQLIDLLRGRPEQEAFDILRRMRLEQPGPDLNENIKSLLNFVRHGDLLLRPQTRADRTAGGSTPESPTFPRNAPSKISEAGPSTGPQSGAAGTGEPVPRRRRYEGEFRSANIEDIISPIDESTRRSPPIVDHRYSYAKNWTTISADENILTTCLTTFFTWQFPSHHWFDKELFLNDMMHKRTNFCSQALVNAVLAAACTNLPWNEPARPFGDNLMTSFYQEARRLWNLNETKIDYPQLHTAILIVFVLNKCGQDRCGLKYSLECIRIANDLGLFRVSPPAWATKRPKDVDHHQWKRSRAVSAWGLFNWMVLQSSVFATTPLLQAPPPIPPPYQEQPGSQETFRATCRLAKIENDCSLIMFRPMDESLDTPPQPEHIEGLYDRLENWEKSLPPSLAIDRNRLPENLSLRMHYYSIIIRMFNPFLLERSEPTNWTKGYSKRARNAVHKAQRELLHLIKVYGANHGWKDAMTMSFHMLNVAAFGCLDRLAPGSLLSDVEADTWYADCMMCIRAIREISNTFLVAQAGLRTLATAVDRSSVELLPEDLVLFELYLSHGWTRTAVETIHSHWPLDLGVGMHSIEHSRLSVLIKKWGKLSAESNDSGSDSLGYSDSI